MSLLTYISAERAANPCCCGKRPNKTVTLVFFSIVDLMFTFWWKNVTENTVTILVTKNFTTMRSTFIREYCDELV